MRHQLSSHQPSLLRHFIVVIQVIGISRSSHGGFVVILVHGSGFRTFFVRSVSGRTVCYQLTRIEQSLSL